MNGWDEWMGGINGWMGGWISGWMDKWMDKRVDEWILYACRYMEANELSGCANGCVHP